MSFIASAGGDGDESADGEGVHTAGGEEDGGDEVIAVGDEDAAADQGDDDAGDADARQGATA